MQETCPSFLGWDLPGEIYNYFVCHANWGYTGSWLKDMSKKDLKRADARRLLHYFVVCQDASLSPNESL